MLGKKEAPTPEKMKNRVLLLKAGGTCLLICTLNPPG